MSIEEVKCPECGGTRLYSDAQNWICKVCGRQFRKKYRKHAARKVETKVEKKVEPETISKEKIAESILDVIKKVGKPPGEQNVDEFPFIGDPFKGEK